MPPIESQADRLSFFADDGETVQVDDRDVTVLFNAPHASLQFGPNTIDASSPYMFGRTTELVDVNDNSLIVVRGKEYRVAGLEPDGLGMTRIRLREA